MNDYIFTSESVSEGHPDKVSDYISDSILDALLEQDPHSRVACETLCKGRNVVIAGEISSKAQVNYTQVVRKAITEIGYTDPRDLFHANGVIVHSLITEQAPDIAKAVFGGKEQGAGDQGVVYGYATDETPELMPLPILLAHRLAKGLAQDRKSGAIKWARPDAKTQVSVRYQDDKPVAVTAVVVSTQHWPDVSQDTIKQYVADVLLPRELGRWHNRDIKLHVNPSGEFSVGGPTADCGLTGRKIIVDTYGGFARHGGGAFSGKDPSKVDRSAAYFARAVARRIVLRKLAKRAEIQVSYAIGVAKPISIKIDTFGTGDAKAAEEFARKCDYRPQAIIEQLDLLRPIYRQTTNYGHFGKAGLPWEESERRLKGCDKPETFAEMATRKGWGANSPPLPKDYDEHIIQIVPVRSNRPKTKLTKEQIEKMQLGLQEIVFERTATGFENDPEDQAKDNKDIVLISSVQTVDDAIDVLECFGMELQSELTVWAGILDPLGGFEAKDDSSEEQERFRQYLQQTYGVSMDKLRPV